MQRPNPWRTGSRETEDFVHSLGGSRLIKIRFKKGFLAQPSSAFFTLKTKKDGKPIQTKITFYDFSGFYHVNGQRESLEGIVSFLRGEMRLLKRIEVREIKINQLQEGTMPNSKSSTGRTLWRAFVRITLQWGENNAVFGDLSHDWGMGICTYLQPKLDPIQEEEMYEVAPNELVLGFQDNIDSQNQYAESSISSMINRLQIKQSSKRVYVVGCVHPRSARVCLV
ncbi:hypothetical protein R1flu_000467 [Riccia fluitans]|uniref:Uncharacterized protein n=1 Tax=Riccia fluitans TaxID=41844 RepID=A0ABD1Y0K5_9MARC